MKWRSPLKFLHVHAHLQMMAFLCGKFGFIPFSRFEEVMWTKRWQKRIVSVKTKTIRSLITIGGRNYINLGVITSFMGEYISRFNVFILFQDTVQVHHKYQRG